MIAAVIGALAGAAITLCFVVAWRLTHVTADLGTDVDRATYRTLSYASRAAGHLRSGLTPEGAQRATRDLRGLLGCDALALADPSDLLAMDGEASRSTVTELSERVRDGGRTQVHRASAPGELDAVAAPVRVGDEPAGVIVAFAPVVRGPLVRATTEVATWIGAQLELRELDVSRAALAEARLRALRAQISPHFIYNALNAIASFINTDPHRARELVLEFADFTRYSFRRHGDFTTLAEELRAIHSYLLLERARFGDRLEVSLQIAPEVLTTVIPFLSVQPLVENAVRHGLESTEHGGHITITATDRGTQTEITVEDDGVGADPQMLRSLLAGEGDGRHVGLWNVDARLRQVYGPDGGLVVETNIDAGMLVRLRVPKSQPLHDLTTGIAPS